MKAAELCAEFDIKIIPTNECRVGRQTHAGQTIERLIVDYGVAHARLVVMTIAETSGNENELRAETLRAISDVLWARPDWEKLGSRWLAAFDQIDLKAMRAKAKKLSVFGMRKSKAMAVLLHCELERLFALRDSDAEMMAA